MSPDHFEEDKQTGFPFSQEENQEKTKTTTKWNWARFRSPDVDYLGWIILFSDDFETVLSVSLVRLESFHVFVPYMWDPRCLRLLTKH